MVLLVLLFEDTKLEAEDGDLMFIVSNIFIMIISMIDI